MSNLLLLADVASKNSSTKQKTADASVQTELFSSFETDGNRPFFQQPNGGGFSADGASGHGNLFELPHLPPLHDYVKQFDCDYVVNSMHDYYNRIAAPDREMEHSYAFFGEGVSDTAANGNGIGDDGCFEAIANLDEYMGIASQAVPDQPLLCEEVVNDEPIFVDNVSDQAAGDEMFDQLSIGSVDVQAVVPLDELDDLIQYILPVQEDANVTEERSMDPGSHDHNEVAELVCEETQSTDTAEPLEPEDGASTSTSTDSSRSSSQPLDKDQLATVRCQWGVCGIPIDVSVCGSFERHIVEDHLRRKKPKKNGRNQASEEHPQRICLWRGCGRTEAFSHRYQLLRHLRQHTSEAPFVCNTCGRAFKSKELMKIHERRSHTSVKRYTCTVCSKSFASTGDLSRHRRVHQTTTTADFVCCDCGLSYKDESGLRKHRKRIHPTVS